MWIYLVSLTISSVLTSAILSVLIPKFKKREERENAFAATNKIVFPDKRLKGLFICLSSFCVLIGLIILFVPQICELMEFSWLLTNIIWDGILLIDLVVILFGYQTLYVAYNDDFILITNIFHKTNKVAYDDIERVSSNVKIFTRNGKYFIPCSLFYGTQALKSKILEKIKKSC